MEEAVSGSESGDSGDQFPGLQNCVVVKELKLSDKSKETPNPN